MARNSHPLSPLERAFSVFTKMGPGEGMSVLLFAVYAFLLLVCYYLLKTTREVFILTEFGAEAASYAIGARAAMRALVVTNAVDAEVAESMLKALTLNEDAEQPDEHVIIEADPDPGPTQHVEHADSHDEQ